LSNEYKTTHSLLEKIIYFSIFNHPLKRTELSTLANINISELDTFISELENSKIIKIEQDYILLEGFSSSKDISNRIDYETGFNKMKSKVLSNSKFISKFPFVKSIAISGSMSKGVSKDDGDIDFFIITANNRLWLCRTILILFKKIFRLNSHKYFCLNYFVSESHLQIPDKNIFTSTELAYLTPTYGKDIFNNLLKTNDWYSEKFPTEGLRINFGSVTKKSYLLKRLIEKTLSSSLGEWLDKKCLQTTTKRWNKKFPNFSSVDMELTMRSKRNVSKHHPSNFQKRVLEEMEKRTDIVNKKLNTVNI